MVRNLAGLKARLFWNGLKSDRQRQIGLPLIAALVTWAGWTVSTRHFELLTTLDPAALPDYLAWAALILFVAWVALPVVIFPIDDNLDPQQLATLPVSRPRLVAGLTAAAFVSVPVLALIGLAIATLAPRPGTLITGASRRRRLPGHAPGRFAGLHHDHLGRSTFPPGPGPGRVPHHGNRPGQLRRLSGGPDHGQRSGSRSRRPRPSPPQLVVGAAPGGAGPCHFCRLGG
jgi:hypothetical protein